MIDVRELATAPTLTYRGRHNWYGTRTTKLNKRWKIDHHLQRLDDRMNSIFKRYGLISIICAALILTGGIDQTTKDALKVKHILRTIERKPQRSGSQDITAEVTEKEVNAYIAYRLARDKRPIVDSLTVKLLDNNHIQGKVRFNAQSLNLGVLLGEKLDFDFKGIFHTRNRAARLDLISLHLAGYPVKPQVLDFVLSTAATYYGSDVGQIDNWYELPKGIRRIAVQKDKATIYY